jgi:WD40 repeat protein
MPPEKLCQISSFNSKGFCSALAFNQVGSIMVSGCKCNIKVWSFHKGKLSKLKTLTEHCDYVYCLVFSKKLNWFASGSRDFTIRGWKEEENNWISSQP